MNPDCPAIAIAEIVRTHGLRGEVVANPLTSRIERFDDVRSVMAQFAGGTVRSLELTGYRTKGTQLLLQFAAIDSIEKAISLVGSILCVPEDEAIELEEDEFFCHQLVGCTVTTQDGRALGEVVKVLEATGTPVLVVHEETGREHLIPFATSICPEVDLAARTILVAPPPGLLEF